MPECTHTLRIVESLGNQQEVYIEELGKKCTSIEAAVGAVVQSLQTSHALDVNLLIEILTFNQGAFWEAEGDPFTRQECPHVQIKEPPPKIYFKRITGEKGEEQWKCGFSQDPGWIEAGGETEASDLADPVTDSENKEEQKSESEAEEEEIVQSSDVGCSWNSSHNSGYERKGQSPDTYSPYSEEIYSPKTPDFEQEREDELEQHPYRPPEPEDYSPTVPDDRERERSLWTEWRSSEWRRPDPRTSRPLPRCIEKVLEITICQPHQGGFQVDTIVVEKSGTISSKLLTGAEPLVVQEVIQHASQFVGYKFQPVVEQLFRLQPESRKRGRRVRAEQGKRAREWWA